MFENYGRPNHIYFQYHGFSLTSENGMNENALDCVMFEFMISREEGEKLDVESHIVQEIVQVIFIFRIIRTN